MATALKNKNTHERDYQIKFYNRGHKYEIVNDPKSKYTSVTTWVHKHFPKFDADAVIENIFKSKSWGPDHKYWGMSADQIKKSWKSNGDAAASTGTNLHERIEEFMNDNYLDDYTHFDLYNIYLEEYQKTLNDKLSFENGTLSPDNVLFSFFSENNSSYRRKTWFDFHTIDYTNQNQEHIEWEYFIHFVRDHPELRPYRTEWMIFDEDLKIAGSIDMVYENPDGTLSIYDWKRSKEISKFNNWNKFAINPLISHLHDTNYWHYTLQLNTYKAIIERKYGKIVSKLCLVRIHPDAEEQTYELIEVPILKKEINDLFEERIREVS